MFSLSSSCCAEAETHSSPSPLSRTFRPRCFAHQVYAPARKSFNQLDVFSPRTGSSHPVIIFFHGGKFSSGDKSSSVFNKPLAFTRRGFIFVSVDYRLSPAVKYPVHAQDVAESVAWIHKNIKRYGGDPDCLFLMGHSAGAALAALISTDARFLAQYGLEPSCLKGTILLDGGSYNFAATARSSKHHDLLNSVFGRDSQVWWQASPIRYVRRGNFMPPFLILYIPNRADATAQALAFNGALKKSGTPSKAVAVQGKTHASLNEDLGLACDKPTAEVFDFLDKYSR
ncbi:MAG: alpha/beta hydrolase [Candidatus Obscuribacterales bacterium]